MRIAAADEVGSSQQGQVFQIVAEAIADAGAHRVDAGVTGLDHDIEKMVDHVGIVALAALHEVDSGATVKQVVAAVAGQDVAAAQARQDVIVRVAIDDVAGIGRGYRRVIQVGDDVAAAPAAAVGELDAVDRPGGVQKVLADGEGFPRGQHAEDQVIAHPGQADLPDVQVYQTDLVEVGAATAAVVDHVMPVTAAKAVGVIAGATDQQVIAGSAVQRVVATQAIKRIAAGRAGQIIVAVIAIYGGHLRSPPGAFVF
ncbi:hypothetical protein D9M69_455890 [compost metagenome]